MKTLMGQAYSPGVTRLDEGVLGGGPRDPVTGTEGLALLSHGRKRTGPIKTNPVFVRLDVAVPLKIFNDNPHRVGLLIQNRDPVANINVSFGVEASANTFALIPGGAMLLDFICPTDSVWFFSTVAAVGVAYEFSPIAQSGDVG